MTMEPLHPEFQACIDRQPYRTVLDGLQLAVDNDVFPPDLGRCAQNLARIACRYPAQAALDMGCGTGYLALMMQRNGVAHVWAADIHEPAVACARRNVAANAPEADIQIVQSDLFSNIPLTVKFDLMVFNQPFGPGSGDTVCGCGPDGGAAIARRFLLASPAYLAPSGIVLMAFSDRVSSEHSPQRIASELGYPWRTVLQEYYNDANNYIYEIRPRRND